MTQILIDFPFPSFFYVRLFHIRLFSRKPEHFSCAAEKKNECTQNKTLLSVKNIFPLYQKGDNSSAEEQINKSIEKTLRTKNDQEKKETERSRSKTSSPMRVSTLASRYETSAMHIPQANTSNLANSRKKYVHLGSLGVSQFYADKEKSKKSGARQARTRSETNMEKHLKRREKIAKGIDIPNQDTPKRVRYEHQL